MFIYQLKLTNEKKHYHIISILPAPKSTNVSESNQAELSLPIVSDYDIDRFLKGRKVLLDSMFSYDPYKR